jgi:hypothetical protein
MDHDNLDLAIFFLCASGLVGFIGMELGEYAAMQRRTYCAATLADGRMLTTVKLGPQGHAGCTYAPIYDARRWRRG